MTAKAERGSSQIPVLLASPLADSAPQNMAPNTQMQPANPSPEYTEPASNRRPKRRHEAEGSFGVEDGYGHIDSAKRRNTNSTGERCEEGQQNGALFGMTGFEPSQGAPNQCAFPHYPSYPPSESPHIHTLGSHARPGRIGPRSPQYTWPWYIASATPSNNWHITDVASQGEILVERSR